MMSELTERTVFEKFVRVLKFVKIREFQEFLKFIKFEFSIYEIQLFCINQNVISRSKSG